MRLGLESPGPVDLAVEAGGVEAAAAAVEATATGVIDPRTRHSARTVFRHIAYNRSPTDPIF